MVLVALLNGEKSRASATECGFLLDKQAMGTVSGLFYAF